MQQTQSLQPKSFQSDHSLSEAQWAQQVLAGDRDAFAYFVEKYSSPLFNYIYRVLHNSETAADILQTIFIRFYNYLPQLNLDRPLKPWLFQVAHNCCIDELRSQRRHMTQPFSILQDEDGSIKDIFSIEDTQANTEEIYEKHDLQSSLQRAIMKQSFKAREVVILRYTSNLTFTQIGEVLHIPEQTAKTYFSRAKKVLRQELAREGVLGIQ